MSRQFEKPVAAGGSFRIGEWLIEPSLNRVSRGDTTIQLELKVMDVLVCLAERAGEVVTRFEIIDRVWATEFIADNTLTHAINEIRTALGDDARNPSFIETIYRRGYRLMVPVTVEERPAGTVAQFPSPARLVTNEDLSPYPGLAAFTEDDAEFFFGRENEVVQMWRKVTSRRLLAVIGPSGVGKSSFIRAGVIPAKPEGWGILICQPGEAPFAALARALAPAFEGDAEAFSRATEFERNAVHLFTRWREQHDRALLIVDQFEELFTLNPAETQHRFAELVSRLAREADIHVLLSLRDDFLYRCQSLDWLHPVLDGLFALQQPNSDSLKRALVEPGRRFDFDFEDDRLASEMIAEVEGERGALPLLAFAVGRLWDKRDRENKTLTRQAYSDIGGVGGALARHAESTMQSIGNARRPIVREIFRNLVTSQGTRAARSVDGLMSVFSVSDRDEARDVLRRLIDARLLTSFEEEKAEGDGCHRVEIVHESLLISWPRLVGWQTQDADAARIRDELRQAARIWDDHDRTNDFLWTGAAFREFRLWHDRYPGGLTELEEDFAIAMIAHAKWRRRRRRLVVAAALLLAVVVTTVTTVLWRQSVRETNRAEAAELVALGQLELESYPTAALAHTIASLELSDSLAARMLAMGALWKGPTVFVVNEKPTNQVRFTSDGQWLTQAYQAAGDGPVRLIGADGSSAPLEGTEGHENTFTPPYGEDSDLFVLLDWGQNQSGEPFTKRIMLFSASEGRIIAEAPYIQKTPGLGVAMIPDDRKLMILAPEGKCGLNVDSLGFDGQLTRLGTREFDIETDDGRCFSELDTRKGRFVATTTGHDIFITNIEQRGLSQPRFLGREKDSINRLAVDPLGRFVASATVGGNIRLWPLTEGPPTESVPGPPNGFLRFTEDGNSLRAVWWGTAGEIQTGDDCQFWIWAVDSGELRFLRRTDVGRREPMSSVIPDHDGGRFVRIGGDQAPRLWSLSAPADAEPLRLLRGAVNQFYMPAFQPDGKWLAVPHLSGLGMWPLARPYPIIIRQHTDRVNDVLFAPDGSWLASAAGAGDGTVKLWPLEGVAPSSGHAVFDPTAYAFIEVLATNSDGSKLLVSGGPRLGIHSVSLDDESTYVFPLSESCKQYFDLAISQDGQMAAATCGDWNPELRKIDIWDLTKRERVAELAKGDTVHSAQPVFVGNNQLLALDATGLRRWDLETGMNSLIQEGTFEGFVASKSARRVLLLTSPSGDDPGRAVFVDLDTGVSTVLNTHGSQIWSLALNAEGTIVVTGDADGTVRVGPATGEEPWVLHGHEQAVIALDIDPLGRWVASGSIDKTVRLWPMPDLSKPPLHTLPHDELIAKLKTLTNLRVVRDEESPTGWTLTHDPFPGWETVPTW